MNELQTYLDTILSKEQQHILAYCLKNDIKVNLMALGGGKTSISWLFEKAGYSLNCDLEAGTTLIICKNRETINVGSVFRRYTVEDVKIWLDKICDCQPIRKKYDKLRYISYKELKKENAELKRQLEERHNIKFNMRINNVTIKKLIVINGTRGDGTKDNPYQNILFYYTLEGEFIGKTPVK